jgi:ferric-dicitrate binding protein FerR (iron transport regulator)
MNKGYREIEELLPGYLSGELSDEDQAMLEEWRQESGENEVMFQNCVKAWEALPMLEQMEQFNSFEALNKINARISERASTNLWVYFQRAAAILLIPLLIYTTYLSVNYFASGSIKNEHVAMQKISSRLGMITQFELSDGTNVWLNSGSSLEFPTAFNGAYREVRITGEAFFKVKQNENQPFRVLAKDLNIEVLGTSFNVASYNDEKRSEVVLVEGKVKLSTEINNVKKDFGSMIAGQRVVYDEDLQDVETEEVGVDKYVAWRDGNLIFRDDKMDDVVRRLSRWFNIEIVINDPEIKSYAYKATFRNETLPQILNLLKISAPIDYRVIGNKLLSNGEYTKQKVYLMKKRKS